LRRRPVQGAQGFAKKIEIDLLSANDALKLGDAALRLCRIQAAVLRSRVRRIKQRLQLPGPKLGTPLAVQPSRALGLPGLVSIIQKLARYAKRAGQRQHRLPSFNPANSSFLERRRKRAELQCSDMDTPVRLSCHRNYRVSLMGCSPS
jgi:hypothetical protein